MTGGGAGLEGVVTLLFEAGGGAVVGAATNNDATAALPANLIGLTLRSTSRGLLNPFDAVTIGGSLKASGGGAMRGGNGLPGK